MQILFRLSRFLALAAGRSAAVIGDDMLIFRLLAKDGRFHPETLEVPAGQRFRLEIANQNAVPEEFESGEPAERTRACARCDAHARHSLTLFLFYLVYWAALSALITRSDRDPPPVRLRLREEGGAR